MFIIPLAAQTSAATASPLVLALGLSSLDLFDLNLLSIGQILFQMTIATLLGAVIAFHPQRFRTKGEIDWEMKKAQILICLAGAMLVLIIGDSLARAFGLVGLGSFIRFRTAVSNPLEVAILFALIVVGMACGLGFLWLAAICTGFVFVLIYALNLHEPQFVEEWEVRTQGGASDVCRRKFEALAGEQGFRITRLNLNVLKNVFTCRFRPPDTVNVNEIDEVFQTSLDPRPDAVLWNKLE